MAMAANLRARNVLVAILLVFLHKSKDCSGYAGHRNPLHSSAFAATSRTASLGDAKRSRPGYSRLQSSFLDNIVGTFTNRNDDDDNSGQIYRVPLDCEMERQLQLRKEPPIATLTWMQLNENQSSETVVQFLQERANQIAMANPWLQTGQLERKSSGPPADLLFRSPFRDMPEIRIAAARDAQYLELYGTDRPLPGVSDAYKLTQKYTTINEYSKKSPLWRITVVPAYGKVGLILSMSHLVADIHTYYKIYDMLTNPQQEIFTLDLNTPYVQSPENGEYQSSDDLAEFHLGGPRVWKLIHSPWLMIKGMLGILERSLWRPMSLGATPADFYVDIDRDGFEIKRLRPQGVEYWMEIDPEELMEVKQVLMEEEERKQRYLLTGRDLLEDYDEPYMSPSEWNGVMSNNRNNNIFVNQGQIIEMGQQGYGSQNWNGVSMNTMNNNFGNQGMIGLGQQGYGSKGWNGVNGNNNNMNAMNNNFGNQGQSGFGQQGLGSQGWNGANNNNNMNAMNNNFGGNQGQPGFGQQGLGSQGWNGANTNSNMNGMNGNFGENQGQSGFGQQALESQGWNGANNNNNMKAMNNNFGGNQGQPGFGQQGLGSQGWNGANTNSNMASMNSNFGNQGQSGFGQQGLGSQGWNSVNGNSNMGGMNSNFGNQGQSGFGQQGLGSQGWNGANGNNNMGGMNSNFGNQGQAGFGQQGLGSQGWNGANGNNNIGGMNSNFGNQGQAGFGQQGLGSQGWNGANDNNNMGGMNTMNNNIGNRGQSGFGRRGYGSQGWNDQARSFPPPVLASTSPSRMAGPQLGPITNRRQISPEFLVSTNDILNAWFFQMTKCRLGLICCNYRGKLENHHENLGRNYWGTYALTKDQYSSPFKIRKYLQQPRASESAFPRMAAELLQPRPLAITSSWTVPFAGVTFFPVISHWPLYDFASYCPAHFVVLRTWWIQRPNERNPKGRIGVYVAGDAKWLAKPMELWDAIPSFLREFF